MLPHYRFVHQVRDGNPVVIYADPSICDCLYMGTPAAFDKYRAAMKARNMEVAEERSDNIAKMDWGAWPAMGPSVVRSRQTHPCGWVNRPTKSKASR